MINEWADWELKQRRYALLSLIASYADMSAPTALARLRRYRRELSTINAEIERRDEDRDVTLLDWIEWLNCSVDDDTLDE